MRHLEKLLTVLALTMVPEAALSQSVNGDWWGALEVAPGARLRLAVHVVAKADGKLAGTLDSLDQNAGGLPLADITSSDGRLAFRLATSPASFDGSWDASAMIWRGELRQNGRAWPLRSPLASRRQDRS